MRKLINLTTQKQDPEKFAQFGFDIEEEPRLSIPDNENDWFKNCIMVYEDIRYLNSNFYEGKKTCYLDPNERPDVFALLVTLLGSIGVRMYTMVNGKLTYIPVVENNRHTESSTFTGLLMDEEEFCDRVDEVVKGKFSLEARKALFEYYRERTKYEWRTLYPFNFYAVVDRWTEMPYKGGKSIIEQGPYYASEIVYNISDDPFKIDTSIYPFETVLLVGEPGKHTYMFENLGRTPPEHSEYYVDEEEYDEECDEDEYN